MICSLMLGPCVQLIWRDRFNQKRLKGWTDWKQEAKKSTFNELINDSGLLASSDMFYSCSLTKDCGEGIGFSSSGSVTGHLPIQLDLVLQEVKPSTDSTNPDTRIEDWVRCSACSCPEKTLKGGEPRDDFVTFSFKMRTFLHSRF